MMSDPATRYKVRAFVSRGTVHPTEDVGTSTFDEIYRRAPDDCQFVIVEHGTVVAAIDLYDAGVSSIGPHYVEVCKHHVFDDYASAVMGALLIYGLLGRLTKWPGPALATTELAGDAPYRQRLTDAVAKARRRERGQ